MPRYRWIEPSRTAEGLELAELGLMGDILATRGLSSMSEATALLNRSLESVPDPSTLPDIEIAASRIRKAIRDGERIAVFGDYDVDGVTSTALLTMALTRMGASVEPFLPHRERDGYGLNFRAVEVAAHKGCSLLITVDCGTGDFAEMQRAGHLGLDTIVIDHHHVTSEGLPAHAFVSPRRPDSVHEFDDYAAVGVTYQLLRFLNDDHDVEQFLPLVALGTVADVVPLLGPNRAIVHQGLLRFDTEGSSGLHALAASAGLHGDRITSHHLAYMLGPRINAAGRIADPHLAFELLMTESPDRARDLADQLSRLNARRQSMLEEAVAEARVIVEMDGELSEPVLVVHSPEWRIGLVGLIASRLSERYSRPVIALEQGSPLSRGSARSIDGFNVVTALHECNDLLDEYGGHSKAAGLTIQTNLIAQFTERINEIFRSEIGPEPPVPLLRLDAEIDPGDVSLDLVSELSRLEPFGHGNPAPEFLMRNVRVSGARYSKNRAHLLFSIARESGTPHRAVSFGSGSRLPEIEALGTVDVALSLRPNTWQGRTSVTLEVHDFRASAEARNDGPTSMAAGPHPFD